ncbi:MAG: phage protein [Myxococcaceae bacterium]
MSFHEYDPHQYSITFNGIPIEGFAEDDFVHIEMATEGFSDEVGADGHVTRIRSRDQRGSVTFKLKASSPTNKILSALYQADLNAPNGSGVGAVLIRDTQGLSIFAGAQAWIAGMPKTSIGKKLGDVEWKLRVASLEGFVG